MKIISQKGQGRVLNLLHGWGMNARLFDYWAEQLAKHFQVNLIDLPGHGDNRRQPLFADLDYLAELCDTLPRGIWLGWSLGGLLALNYALQTSINVESLIMLCATPCLVKRASWKYGIDETLLLRFGTDLQQDISQAINAFLALEVMGVADEKILLQRLRKQVFSQPLPSIEALENGLKLLQNSNLTAKLPTLKVPSLWLSGRRDRLVLAAAMEQSAKLCNGHYQMLHDASHAPFLHNTEKLSTIIKQWGEEPTMNRW